MLGSDIKHAHGYLRQASTEAPAGLDLHLEWWKGAGVGGGGGDSAWGPQLHQAPAG